MIFRRSLNKKNKMDGDKRRQTKFVNTRNWGANTKNW